MPPRRRPELELSEIEPTGETIAVDPATGKATVLNAMATIVWLLCDGTRDAAAICAEIRQANPELAVEPARLQRDVERVLVELTAEGLVG